MRNEIAVPLIALSVAMNVAVIGVWAGHAALAGGEAGRAAEKTEIRHPLHHRLDLTAGQQRALEPKVSELKDRTRDLNMELGRLRAGLLDMIDSENPDPAALAARQDEITAVQARLQRLVVEQLLAEKEILTPAQRQELFMLLRDRCGCAGHSGMGVPCDGGSPCGENKNPESNPCKCTKGGCR